MCGVVQDGPVVFHCFPCQGEGGCFPPYIRPTGAIPGKTGS